MEMLISTHLGLQAVKFGIVGLQGLQRQRWEIPRKGPCLLASYPQLSNKHRSLCCLQTPSSWRHWNLGNSYFWVGEFIHQLDSTCTDKPCKIHLQNQNHLSYQILPDPTRSYQHILDFTKACGANSIYKKQQHILDENRWSTSWQCEQIEVPKNTYQVWVMNTHQVWVMNTHMIQWVSDTLW